MSMADRLRRGARRGAAAAAGSLPVGRGPGALQQATGRARLAEARRVLLGRRDPRGALQLAEPLTEVRPVASEAWVLVAEAREKLGEGQAALAAARRATEAGTGLAALLLHLRLAEELGEPAEARSLRDRLVSTPIGSVDELQAVVTALRAGDRSTSARLADVLRNRPVPGWETAVDELHAELSIVEAAAGDVPAAVSDVVRRLSSPVAPVVRALTRRGEWTRLVALVQPAGQLGSPAPAEREAAALEIRRAGSAALKAGWAGAAATLARTALDLRPDDRYAADTLLSAEDQLAIAGNGWTAAAPAAAPASYTSRPRAVLSVLAQSLPVRTGGYATRSHGIATGLASLGWDVEAVTRLGFPYDQWPAGDSRTVPEHDVVDRIAYHRILEPGRRTYPQHPLADYVARYSRAVEDHARRHGAALLHASSFHVNGLAARDAAARLGIPYVYEMRGLEDLMRVSRDPGFAGSDRYRFLREVELASCAAAERVFVITEALKAEMVTRGVPAAKLVVLPNGVHADRFQPAPRDADLEARLGLAGKTVIGYAGSIVDYEGLDLLLEAVGRLRRVRDDFHVLIVGDGASADEVRRVAAQLELGDVVTFTGRVPHEEVSRYLSLFDIAPFPRLPLPVCEMISPIKPFESMAAGVVPVASSVAALVEIVDHERTGLVFEKGSADALAAALTRLLDDPDLRRRLGDEARAWVRAERDWSTIVRIVDQVYRDVLP